MKDKRCYLTKLYTNRAPIRTEITITVDVLALFQEDKGLHSILIGPKYAPIRIDRSQLRL